MKTAYIAKQRQISFVKSHFSRQLEERLGLIEVQAPILSRVGDGTQDNLSGCEKAVQVKVKALVSLLAVIVTKKTSCITYGMTALNTLLRLHQPEAVRVSA